MKFLAGENLEDRVSDYTYSGAVDHGRGGSYCMKGIDCSLEMWIMN